MDFLRCACVGLFSLWSITIAGSAYADLRQVPASREQVQLSFAPVVKNVAPAVVNIYTSRKVRVQSPFMADPLFQHFFGGRLGMPLGEKTVNSLGSGVIISADGLIVTSNHVIKDSHDIKVILADRRELEGKIILTDEQSDLALLRIDAGKEALPFLPLRDSDALEVGDLVLAVGNPFGVGQTVTSGIISALARTTIGVADFQFFIQTDAAINPGNSGGALVDMSGRLIGVNTAIYSTSGASNGIGFAIPANMVRSVVANAEAGSTRVVRPWLGVGVQRVNGEIAESLGLRSPKGVLITEIAPGSPAEKAGVRVGDIVFSINGFDVQDEQGMHFRAAIIPLNEYATFSIWRNGEELDVKVKMLAPPEIPARDARTLAGQHPFHTITVANLSPALAVELDMDMTAKGVVIVDARGNRFLQKGDIVREVNGTAITTSKALEALLKKGVSRWQLMLQRGNQTLQVMVR